MPLSTTRIVNPGMVGRLVLAGFYPLTVSIKSHDGTQDALNQPDYSYDHWVTVEGMASVRARKTPISASVLRAPDHTETAATDFLLLDALYPSITTLHRVDIAGTLWRIEGPEENGQSTFTRLRIGEVTT
jgi:hypothetical protein